VVCWNLHLYTARQPQFACWGPRQQQVWLWLHACGHMWRLTVAAAGYRGCALGALVRATQCEKGTRANVGARVLGHYMWGNMLVVCHMR
jgi:hypothetical protein